jgi:hypothetical protein
MKKLPRCVLTSRPDGTRRQNQTKRHRLFDHQLIVLPLLWVVMSAQQEGDRSAANGVHCHARSAANGVHCHARSAVNGQYRHVRSAANGQYRHARSAANGVHCHARSAANGQYRHVRSAASGQHRHARNAANGQYRHVRNAANGVHRHNGEKNSAVVQGRAQGGRIETSVSVQQTANHHLHDRIVKANLLRTISSNASGARIVVKIRNNSYQNELCISSTDELDKAQDSGINVWVYACDRCHKKGKE